MIPISILLLQLSVYGAHAQKKHPDAQAGDQNKPAPAVYHAAIRVIAKAYGTPSWFAGRRRPPGHGPVVT
jgi:hypothetical protein